MVHFADPWCWWSWGLEPVIQRLKAVYGEQIHVSYRMGGITDDVSDWRRRYNVETDDALRAWISESSSMTGMPTSTENYLSTRVKTTWPACVAVKAAQMQGEEVGEKFYRKLVEEINLADRNGSDEKVDMEVAEEVGLDVLRMKRDIKSGAARKLFEKDSEDMKVSFLTLTYIDPATGKEMSVEGRFGSKEHEHAIEHLTDGKLVKKTPVDIMEYFERHEDATVFPKEISEVFQIGVEHAQLRLRKLEDAGLLESKSFKFGGKGWKLSPKGSKKQIGVDLVKISHITSPSEELGDKKMEEVITNAVVNLYTQVANDPHKTYHFPLGREALLFVGYRKDELDKLPEGALESFAGVGYPHAGNVIRAGDTVLDIGSGSGTDVLVSSLRTGPTGRVTGLDITDAMIEKARANIAKMGAKNVKIIKGNATQIPLEGGSVDVVTSNGVLNLVPDKKTAFEEIFRVLKPGGRLQIADIVVQKDVQKVCGLVPQLWADCIGGAALESEYLNTMKKAGFKDVSIIKRLDYFGASSSDNTKRLTSAFGAESVVMTANKPN